MSHLNPIALRSPVTARDPHEGGRVATNLELLFDLVFVVAIASNSAQLHHGIVASHWGTIVGYTMTWFAIWWAWMGYTWYASAYDNDDVVFRLLSFVVMTGALILAAGVPDIFADGQSLAVVAGYAVMRLGLVGLWLRAAKGDPAHRAVAIRYAVAVTLVQLLWIARLAVPESWLVPSFFVGVALELSVPMWAERSGQTPYHPHHVAERYGLLTIIVLGEVILSGVQAVQVALAEHGLVTDLIPLIVGALLIVFSVWWVYFKRAHHDMVEKPGVVWVFGYGHLLIFASVAAVGAGIAAAIDVARHLEEATATPTQIGLVIGAALAIFSVTLAGIHAINDRADRGALVPGITVAIGVLLIPLFDLSMGWTVLAQALVLTASVVVHVLRSQVHQAA